jgi:hypothetical protein
MMNDGGAVVKETCVICGQGRLFVAITDSIPKDIFIVCEDCESEWDSPRVTCDKEMATRDKHTFSRYATVEDVAGHLWEKFILNR